MPEGARWVLRALGALVDDLDVHELVDFALGETGASAVQSPFALVEPWREESVVTEA